MEQMHTMTCLFIALDRTIVKVFFGHRFSNGVHNNASGGQVLSNQSTQTTFFNGEHNTASDILGEVRF